MGIPKFFRYISERWPMISQLIDGTQIPEFDNLYLDMNSILHTCTHANDDDVTKRLSEEEVFAKIFTYIDHLFHTIKPQKTFYMAIDGVAPRAKMNQQRARRFRTAMDAEKNLKNAIERGEPIPKGEPFDSNSITPGTEFMAKLTQNLKYFIHDKISNDSLWNSAEIILSGHEVPGEGEHKIMSYIRTMRAQKDYNPNTRHCIYGLDADLIMLGLSTHDPHCALLREEVVFGRRQKTKALEHQNFFLLHLSIMREYLELEFLEIADELSFEFDFERILDDFILVMFVIGNDFLPNLPELHLNKGAFPVLLQTFKEALRHSDGYMNENGTINLKRLQGWFTYLAKFEQLNFEKADVDVEWFNKQLENISIQGEKKRARMGKKLLLKQQKKIVGMVKPWLFKTLNQELDSDKIQSSEHVPTLSLESESVMDNLSFLKELAFDLGLFVAHSQSTDTYSLMLDVDGIDPTESNDQRQERINELKKTIKSYERSIIVEDEDELQQEQQTYDERFDRWKDQYYKEKLGFSYYDTNKLKLLAENYVEGLQWVLYYYYRGCQSWPWFYKYHYAPRVSDVKLGLDQIIRFDLGTPFKPFQQLMAVLPERSKTLIPACYRTLMFDPHSPILDLYPAEVELDKNGKTADWEAVVKLPFVDEKRLIDAMASFDAKLSPEEKARNAFGKDLVFVYNPQVDNVYKSPLSGVFSDIEHNHCVEHEFIPRPMDGLEPLFGLPEGVKLGAEALAGFPTLKTVPFDYKLDYNECLIFQQPSKQQSMLLFIKDVLSENNLTSVELAKRQVGNIVYSRWPYLRECKLLSINDGEKLFEVQEKRINNENAEKTFKVVQKSLDEVDRRNFRTQRASMIKNYSTQRGVKLNDIKLIAKVVPVNGLIRNADGAYVKTFSSIEEFYPVQLIVEDVKNKDIRYAERPPLPIEEEFPQDSNVIFLGDYAYGGGATIDGYSSKTRLKLTVEKRSMKSEPKIGKLRAKMDESSVRYYPSYIVSKKLQLHPLFLSRLTSKFIVADAKGKSINVGLNIKFESRREKVLGYARRNVKGWEYSNLTMELISEYRRNFRVFFDNLSNHKGDIPNIQNLCPGADAKELGALVDQISSWLKVVKQSFVTVSLESDSLTKTSIAAVENEIEAYSKGTERAETKQLAKVPREAVLDPKTSYTLLRSQRFDLGDRVIYAQDSGKVPLFSKGTVVGYTTIGSSLSIQVVFDDEIVAGNDFGGRLRTKRGLGLDSSLLLNLTNRQFIYHSKASQKNKDTSVKRVDAKMNHPKAVQRKKAPSELKKMHAHELLTVIQNKNDEPESKPASNGEAPENPSQTATFPTEGALASNVYQAVFNQFSEMPVKSTPVQPTFGLPYAMPPNLPPPGYAMPPVPHGYPPMHPSIPGVPTANVGPGLPFHNQALSNGSPIQHGNEKPSSNHAEQNGRAFNSQFDRHERANSRGSSRGRGRRGGITRGRGGNGRGRGRGNHAGFEQASPLSA